MAGPAPCPTSRVCPSCTSSVTPADPALPPSDSGTGGWKPSPPFLLALAILAVAAVCLWLSMRRQRNSLNQLIAEEIRFVVGRPHRRGAATEVESRKLWNEVGKFYGARNERPAWLDGASLKPEAVQLLGSLSGMSKEGID